MEAVTERVMAADAARMLGDSMPAIAREVNVQVGYYASRCWWAEDGDLRGDAWELALDAMLHYAPEKGSVGAYVGVAIRRGLATRLIFAGSPVHETWHNRHNLIGVHRAPLDKVEGPARSVFARGEEHGPSIRAGAPAGEGGADEVLGHEQWRARVRARLEQVVGRFGKAGLDALLGRGPKRTGRPSAELTASVEYAQARIRADEELCALFVEAYGQTPAEGP